MPLISVTAGPYSVFYGNTPSYLGVLDDNGVEISWVLKSRLVNKTDSYADTLINGYFTGADFRMRFICKESPSDNVAAAGYTSLDANWGGLYGFNQPGSDIENDDQSYFLSRSATQAFGFVMPTIGGEFDQFSLPIVLNAIGTTSTSSSFTTLTALRTIPRMNQQRAINLTSKIRLIPVELDLLPYFVEDGNLAGLNAWFTCT